MTPFEPHNASMAEISGGISLTNESMWQHQATTKKSCANCKLASHELATCKGPLTREGTLRGCAYCNTKAHSWDKCELRSRTPLEDYYYEVELRTGRAPIEMEEDWRVKHQSIIDLKRNKEGQSRWPWSREFANLHRLTPHDYKANSGDENYLHDSSVIESQDRQGSIYSVEMPDEEILPQYQVPPPPTTQGNSAIGTFFDTIRTTGVNTNPSITQGFELRTAVDAVIKFVDICTKPRPLQTIPEEEEKTSMSTSDSHMGVMRPPEIPRRRGLQRHGLGKSSRIDKRGRISADILMRGASAPSDTTMDDDRSETGSGRNVRRKKKPLPATLVRSLESWDAASRATQDPNKDAQQVVDGTTGTRNQSMEEALRPRHDSTSQRVYTTEPEDSIEPQRLSDRNKQAFDESDYDNENSRRLIGRENKSVYRSDYGEENPRNSSSQDNKVFYESDRDTVNSRRLSGQGKQAFYESDFDDGFSRRLIGRENKTCYMSDFENRESRYPSNKNKRTFHESDNDEHSRRVRSGYDKYGNLIGGSLDSRITDPGSVASKGPRKCFNCLELGHGFKQCTKDCQKCGHSSHILDKCVDACKCAAYPGHTLDECTVPCSLKFCKMDYDHLAKDCTLCCMCSSSEHSVKDCPHESCPCGIDEQHFGCVCSHQEFCQRPNCENPLACLHCATCGAKHGGQSCLAARVGDSDVFHCWKPFCDGTYERHMDCQTCKKRDRLAHIRCTK